MSRATMHGMTQFASGMNHPPIAQPMLIPPLFGAYSSALLRAAQNQEMNTPIGPRTAMIRKPLAAPTRLSESSTVLRSTDSRSPSSELMIEFRHASAPVSSAARAASRPSRIVNAVPRPPTEVLTVRIGTPYGP